MSDQFLQLQGDGHQGGRGAGRPPPADPVSDKATLFLIRRTLCADQLGGGSGEINSPSITSSVPVEELLPPLTSRNDVDLQLYALLAIVLREFVQNWYNKITPDQTFFREIVHLIAHITRALEERLRGVDLESLLFDELPELLDRHVHGWLLYSSLLPSCSYLFLFFVIFVHIAPMPPSASSQPLTLPANSVACQLTEWLISDLRATPFRPILGRCTTPSSLCRPCHQFQTRMFQVQWQSKRRTRPDIGNWWFKACLQCYCRLKTWRTIV